MSPDCDKGPGHCLHTQDSEDAVEILTSDQVVTRLPVTQPTPGPPPVVSICVPLYNGARYLEACLTGITRQGFKDFEVVIVDDCSVDEGPEMAKEWAHRDSRFRFYGNERNLGLVGNWNRCLQLARGEWVKFLFQDDTIEPDCLETMLQVGRAGGGFVACARSFIFEGAVDPELSAWYIRHARILAGIYGDEVSHTADDYSRVKLQNLSLNIVGEPSATLVRRSLFDRFGAFDPLLVQLCDSEMWNRLGTNVGIDFIARPLVSFRVHAASATQANQARLFRSVTLEEIIEMKRMCNSPHMARFRDYARSQGKWLALRRLVMRRINQAYEQARRARAPGQADDSLTKDVNTVFPLLPGYKTTRVIYFLYTLRRIARSGLRASR